MPLAQLLGEQNLHRLPDELLLLIPEEVGGVPVDSNDRAVQAHRHDRVGRGVDECVDARPQVFVELFKKTREVKRQAELLKEKNQELENANLERLNMLIDLGQELTAERDPQHVLENFCQSARRIVGASESAVV